MKTLAAAALVLGVSSLAAHAEWEILDPGTAPGVAAPVVEGSSDAPDIVRITRALERAGYTDVKLQLLPVWSGTAIKNGREVKLRLDAYGQVMDQR